MVLLYQRRQLYRSACIWSRQEAARAFNSWRGYAEWEMEYLEKLYKAMFRWAHMSTSLAFNTWLAKTRDSDDESMEIAAQHYKFASLFVVLDTWRDMVYQSMMAQSDGLQDASKADAHRDRSLLRAAFLFWKPTETTLVVDQTEASNVLAQACHPFGSFEVSVTGTLYGDSDRALYYLVQVDFTGRKSYNLEKRYREFDVLNSTLAERFSGTLKSGTAFPPRKPINRLNPEFYESRVADLHKFMQDLIRHKEIAASGELCEFLEFQNYYYN
jgi:hypothetical protein